MDECKPLAPGLLWMDQHSGAAGGRCSVLGAALLQTVLKFPPDTTPQFVESVASLTAAEAISAACDAGGRGLHSYTSELNLSKFGTHSWIYLEYVAHKDSSS